MPVNRDEQETPKKKRPPNSTAFKPGQSGNPSGVPRKTADFKIAMRDRSQKAIDIIDANLDSADPVLQKHAVDVVIRWGHGEPPKHVLSIDDKTLSLQQRLEVALEQRALDGDTTALLARLRALDPVRYGGTVLEADGEGKTIVRFVRLDDVRPGHEPEKP